MRRARTPLQNWSTHIAHPFIYSIKSDEWWLSCGLRIMVDSDAAITLRGEATSSNMLVLLHGRHKTKQARKQLANTAFYSQRYRANYTNYRKQLQETNKYPAKWILARKSLGSTLPRTRR